VGTAVVDCPRVCIGVMVKPAEELIRCAATIGILLDHANRHDQTQAFDLAAVSTWDSACDALRKLEHIRQLLSSKIRRKKYCTWDKSEGESAVRGVLEPYIYVKMGRLIALSAAGDGIARNRFVHRNMAIICLVYEIRPSKWKLSENSFPLSLFVTSGRTLTIRSTVLKPYKFD
jgi:hypothetical protein